MTTPKSNPSKHYNLFGSSSYVDTAVSGRGHFQDFRPGFRFWHICHVDRHGHFTLKQLRLPVLNETQTNSYTGPRLICKIPVFKETILKSESAITMPSSL